MKNMVYLDSTYSISSFHSEKPDGFKIGFGSGNYLHSHFLVGKDGRLSIGGYVILEATNILVNDFIEIGDFCMFSWGSYLIDSWLDEQIYPSAVRKEILIQVAKSDKRYPELPNSKPVIIEENVWVRFDVFILPGVRLGSGCVVGCKTVISNDVQTYAIIVGSPPHIIKFLNEDDKEEERKKAVDLNAVPIVP